MQRDLRRWMPSSMRPSSLNSFLSCLSNPLNNIPNHKLSSHHYCVMFRTDLKLFTTPWAFSTTGRLPCSTVTLLTTSETRGKGFPSSSATRCVGVNGLCPGFVSKWNSQAFCLDCPQWDSSKAVTKYSRFLYLCSTKNSKWNPFKKCWKVQKCQFKKEIMGKER